jgi:hypothetical protein
MNYVGIMSQIISKITLLQVELKDVIDDIFTSSSNMENICNSI